jgi:hypothetical protein
MLGLDALSQPFERGGPELERMFGDALETALASLRRRVEQGVSWQAA